MKYTKVKLELITDYDMVLFLDRAMYGGVSFVGKYVCVCVWGCVSFFCFAGHQYAKANIIDTEFYDSNQPESCILAVDAANLYGE